MEKRKHGFTLVEIVVVAALVAILGTIIASVIINGLRASVRNQANIRCKENGKLVLETLEKEISQSASIQYYNRMPSGVILPCPYSPAASAIHRVDLAPCESTSADYRIANDRVIFSELASTTGLSNYTILRDAGGNDVYRYVELTVPAAARNTLVRKVYQPVNGSNEGVAMSSSGDWGPDLNYFTGDANLAVSGGVAMNDTLVALPNVNDRITFTVKRKAAPESLYNTFYNRYIVYIEVSVVMTLGGEQWSDNPSDVAKYKIYKGLPRFLQTSTVNIK